MRVPPSSRSGRFTLSAAGFMATRTFGWSPGVRMSRLGKVSWKPGGPGGVAGVGRGREGEEGVGGGGGGGGGGVSGGGEVAQGRDVVADDGRSVRELRAREL